MNRYIIETKDGKQSDALIKYLKTLDFVQVKTVKVEESTSENKSSKMKELLNRLPDQPYRQADVNKAIKDIRKEHRYQ